jgi:NET1-associated nuclear protein 1 (U3 small nucleolar RNA-associated protein 17)
MSKALFWYSNDAICVADDKHVQFFAPKNLKKFRVESFTDHRVACLTITRSAEGSVLHVVDIMGNYVEVLLSSISVQRSTTMRRPGAEEAKSKPVVSTRRPPVGKGAADSTNPFGSDVLGANFYEVPHTGAASPYGAAGDLRCVVLTAEGLFDLSTTDETTSYVKYLFPKPLSGLMMDVGSRSGVVAVGQRGQRWAYTFPAGPVQSMAAQQVTLSANLESVACHPEEPSVAFGGTRGELLVYPSIYQTHCFSDHWHHTPLQALSFSVDGYSLYTGAGEGVMLVWSMSSFTFRKLGVHLGGIHALVPNCDDGARLLLPCSDSSLATVDLLRQHVDKSIEGVQWSSAESCTGLVVTRWMGQEAVILTGLPDVVRVCDPVSQQAFYSLHVRTQLETAAPPPECGIKHVGCLADGKTLVTYEEYGAAALPTALRFWSFDISTKRHVETQCIYSPHRTAVLSLAVDNVRRRVFTLSKEGAKCWAESSMDANDATSVAVGGHSKWSCVSTTATPSAGVRTLSLSEDGSVCMIADDTVYLYGVGNVTAGVRWPLLTRLSQDLSTEALSNVSLDLQVKAVSANNSSTVFVWSLETGELRTAAASSEPARVAAIAHKPTTASVVCAFTDGSVKELSLPSCTQMASAPAGLLPTNILHIRHLDGNRFAVVDGLEGYRTLSVQLTKEGAGSASLVSTSSSGVDQSVEDDNRGLQHYFRLPAAAEAKESDAARTLANATQAATARMWLSDILEAAPYTAPPASSLLHGYLQTLTGV